jgi:hypothetical protein
MTWRSPPSNKHFTYKGGGILTYQNFCVRPLGSSRRRGAGRLVGFGQRIGDFGQVKLPLLVDDQTQRWAFKSEIRKSPCPADKTLKLGIDEQALKAKDWLAIYLFEGPQEAIPTLPLKLYRTDDLYHTASPHP